VRSIPRCRWTMYARRATNGSDAEIASRIETVHPVSHRVVMRSLSGGSRLPGEPLRESTCSK
jgi:hypothetical protein